MYHDSSAQALQVDDLNLAEIGPKFEHHVMFPARTNTGQLNQWLSLGVVVIVAISIPSNIL